MFSVVVGTAVAGVTAAIALHFLRPAFAVFAGLVVAFTPSQVLFSAVVLREAHVWLGMACAGLGLVLLTSPGRRAAAGGLALIAAGLLALAFLREQTLLAMAWALAIVVLFTPMPQRLPRIAAVLAVAALVPWIGGFGLAGWRSVSHTAPKLGETRAKLATGANSAVVAPRPATPGGGSDAESDSVGADVSRFPQGVLDSAIRPYPWESNSGIALLLARFENIWWYLLYGLAGIGVAVSLRRRRARAVLQLPALVIAAVLAISALTQGNLGTAFRHREQVLWALALCAGAGLQWLLTQSRWARRPALGGLPPAVEAPVLQPHSG
jgi:hypothetical protein